MFVSCRATRPAYHGGAASQAFRWAPVSDWEQGYTAGHGSTMADSGRATIGIEYCFECAFTLRAVRASQELLVAYEDRVDHLKLIPGGDNAFEVTVNDQLVFSRLKLGRHPEEGELVRKVGEALGR
jgi:selenoprotein W-related protein